MSSKSKSSLSQIRNHIVATLDLHGYQRNHAIRQVTDFLETNKKNYPYGKAWVRVITGTGAHSSSIGGPILRTAVQELLQKRQMEFVLDPQTRGMFFINANSGFELQSKQETPASSKIRVLPAPQNGMTAVTTTTFPIKTKQKLRQQQLTNEQLKLNYLQNNSQQNRQREHLNYIEDEEYVQALIDSKMEHSNSQHEEEQCRYHEEEELLLAMSLSENQAQPQDVTQALHLSCQQEKEEGEEDDELQKALRLSTKHHEKEQYYYSLEEKEELRRIMKASQQLHDESVLSQREMDEAFQQALQLSLTET